MGTTALLVGAALATVALGIGPWSPIASRQVFRASLAAIWIAVAVAVAALIRVDTSLVLVVDHTRPGLDVFRRIMGLWGGSAGSLLLFVAVVGTVLAVAPTDRRAVAAGPLVVAPLAWASVFITQPFERLESAAIAGSGLSPILEHWAMLIHPPLLYLGLALALVPAVAHPQRTPGWTRAAIMMLTAALALGGGWAYVELGWGGWWAWDPVENAALIPWLLLVVQLHLRSDHAAARWAALAIWPAVIGGTAMTRTSLRTSVHAFADAASLRWVLWPLTIAVVVGAFALRSTDDHRRTSPVRATAPRLMAATVLLFTAVVVALGTFRPFLPGDGTDGTFYARSLYPIAVLGPVALGVAPRWRRTPPDRLTVELLVGGSLGLGLAVLAGWTAWFQLLLAVGLGAGIVTVVAAGFVPPARTLAHLGIILVLVGALGGTASVSRTLRVDVNESFEVGNHTITNLGSRLLDDTARPVLVADVRVDDGPEVRPALTFYPERGLRLPEVATVSRPWEDVQVILRDADDGGSATLTVNQQPLTQFVWYGAVLLAAGALAGVPGVGRLFGRTRRSRSAGPATESVTRPASPDVPSTTR